MAFADELSETAIEHCFLQNLGAFYGHAAGLAPSAGLIFSPLAYPIFNDREKRFEARRGPVLILTHECDIDQANEREFNKNFIVAPIIPIPGFADAFDDDNRRDLGRNLARDIARDRISRMFYLPPTSRFIAANGLALGAFIYLNALASSHISQFDAEGVRAVCALSEYGMAALDQKLHNHFLRPKAERLAQLT